MILPNIGHIQPNLSKFSLYVHLAGSRPNLPNFGQICGILGPSTSALGNQHHWCWFLKCWNRTSQFGGWLRSKHRKHTHGSTALSTMYAYEKYRYIYEHIIYAIYKTFGISGIIVYVERTDNCERPWHVNRTNEMMNEVILKLKLVTWRVPNLNSDGVKLDRPCVLKVVSTLHSTQLCLYTTYKPCMNHAKALSLNFIWWSMNQIPTSL